LSAGRLVEEKPEDFYTSTINTIKEVIKKSGVDSRDIASIAFSGKIAGILGINRIGSR